MISEEFSDRIHEIRRLYNTAEADLKNVGRVVDSLVVTGVNQCRYVGQHLLRALVETDKQKIEDHLDAAKRHAQRAIYDINDSAIQYYVRQIDDLRNKHFPTVDFAAIVPQYGEIIGLVATIKSRIETTNESLNHREDFYSQIKDDVAALRKAYETLNEFRPDLIRAVKKENQKKLRRLDCDCNIHAFRGCYRETMALGVGVVRHRGGDDRSLSRRRKAPARGRERLGESAAKRCLSVATHARTSCATSFGSAHIAS